MSWEYTIVTAWYNLRERENHAMKNDAEMKHFCTPAHYYKAMSKLLEKEFPIVIFTEPACEGKIWDLRPKSLHHITRVIVKDYDELSMYCHFEKFAENHNKNKIANLDPVKFTSLYKFLVLQKTEFLKEVVMANPFDTPQFAWMDTRLHDIYNATIDETNEVFQNMDPLRVFIHQMAYTKREEIADKKGYYWCTRGKIAAGFFGGYARQLLDFAILCKKEILECISIGLAPTDEMVYGFVVGQNPDLFKPYFGDYSEMLKNARFVRNNAYLANNFLNISFDVGNHYYTTTVCAALKKGHTRKDITLSTVELYHAWYYDYVANYWLNNKPQCSVILNGLYELCLTNEDVKQHIKNIRDFFINNISYLGDAPLIAKFKDIVAE